MGLPSGKRLQFANWKIPIVKFGKSTISMDHFQVRELLVITRGYIW